jgi:hypothetical protein
MGADVATARRCSWSALLKQSEETDERRLAGAVFLHVAKTLDPVGASDLLYNLTSAVFLHVAKTLHAVWAKGLLYRLTGVVFLHVAKTLDAVWAKDLLYRLIVLHFPFYPQNTVPSYLCCPTFQSVTPTRCVMRTVVV